MFSFKCRNCGGEMTVSRMGDLACPYCGSRNFFSDRELQEYKAFRLQMLEYLCAIAEDSEDTQSREKLWGHAETAEFTEKDGTDITVQYLYVGNEDGIRMYSARNNVIYIYPSSRTHLADAATASLSGMSFPQADMKGLERCFPTLVGRYELKDGSIMMVYAKAEDLYPLAVFGNLSAKHVEWIISRLENIACVLQYNDMSHGGISPESVFINPKTHEAALLGGWHKANLHGYASEKDLQDIRITAERLLGEGYGDAPEPLIRFLQGKPAKDAYDDFAKWDEVIERELGGRHFTKFEA